jgi:glycerol-3-phosphate dehydrogenase
MLANYCALENVERAGDVWSATLHDRLSDRRMVVKSRCVVNAGGAWASEFGPSRVRLRLTKGVHVVIDRSRLEVPEAVVMTEGSRILFAIPWGERVILGTTDTDYNGPLDSPGSEPGDVDYILGIANRNFPTAKLSVDDVISSWSGLRPLIADPNGKPSDISRRHQIRMTEPGWFDIAGGKLTTYRLMAEQAVDQIVSYAKLDVRACETDKAALLAEADAKFSGILPAAVSREAVEHYCRKEWAVNLADVMIRRTSWRYYHREHAEIAQKVAEWMGEVLRWDEKMREAQMIRYRDVNFSSAGDPRDVRQEIQA